MASARSVLWTIQFRDAYRAQYYLSILQKSEDELRKSVTALAPTIVIPDSDNILRPILRSLADELDGILLPVVAHEIASAKSHLVGDSPQKRYQHFFVSDADNQWTERAKSIPKSYPWLFEMLNKFCQSTTACVVQCFGKLLDDIDGIVEAEFISEKVLTECGIGLSDRHRGGRSVVILTFTPGTKILFKPRDLQPDLLFQEFITLLDLKPPYDLKTGRVLVCDGYGWCQFVTNQPCKSRNEVEGFYRRAGLLTAVMDSLNYCDGNFENVVAAGAYPVIVDCETLFHNFEESLAVQEDPELVERSILFTGLVEKPPKKGQQRGYSSAFQSPSVRRYYFLRPFGVNDGTDKLSVQFRGIHDEPNHHSPALDGKTFIVNEFKEEFIEGFCRGYDIISKAVPDIISNMEWWKLVSESKPRQLIRHTMFYELCIRRIQQPGCCVSEERAKEEISTILSGKESQYLFDAFMIFKNVETEDLLQLDIPYFQHMPGEKSVYSSMGVVYTDVFTKTAVDDMRERFLSRNTSYRDRQVEIVKNILIPTEHVLMQLYGKEDHSGDEI